MQKIILSAIAVLMAITVNVQSQQIQDGGFETGWIEKDDSPKGSYWDLNSTHFFTTLNSIYTLEGVMGNGPLTAFRETTDAYDGIYSLKLMSDNMTSPYGSVFLPGAMGTLTIDFLNIECRLGTPYTSRPDSITGYFKYTSVNGDSAAIEVIMKNGGSTTGGGKKMITSNVSDWQRFSVPISSNRNPDEIAVIFASSANYDFTSIQTLMACKGQVGSTLFLDDIAFTFGTSGIKEMLTPAIEMSVFPNPSTEQVTIQIGKETNGTIAVYDYLSRKVGEYPVNGTQTTINIADYATGSYLLNIIENNKVITTGRFLKQ